MITSRSPSRDHHDFYDKLKGMTSGYGTMDYEVIGYKPDNLVKMDILVNGDPVEASPSSSTATKPSSAAASGQQTPRADPPPPGSRSPSRPPSAPRSSPAKPSRPSAKTSPPSATAAMSAATQTPRKAEGRQERMKSIGSVEIPQEAFMAVLDQGD